MYYALFAVTGLIAGIAAMLFFAAIYSRITARRRAARRAKPGKPEKKCKVQFSKALAVWAAVIATAVIIASVALAAFDKQPVSDLAVAVFTACIGYMVTYAGKSAYEKNSRNKHGLDEDGQPFDKE